MLPQRDLVGTGRQSGQNAANAIGLRRERGDTSMIGKRARIKFPQRPNLFVLPVNPESIEVVFPTRLEVTQSLSSPYFDSFGKGLGSGQMAGTCGWGVPLDDPGQGITGLQRLLEFKRLYEEWQNETVLRSTLVQTTCDLFFDFSQQMYQIVWQDFRISENKTAPMLVSYNATFVITHDYNAPVVILPLTRLDQAGTPPNDGGSPTVQPEGAAR